MSLKPWPTQEDEEKDVLDALRTSGVAQVILTKQDIENAIPVIDSLDFSAQGLGKLKIILKKMFKAIAFLYVRQERMEENVRRILSKRW